MPWAGTDVGSPIRMWQGRPRRRLGACSYPVVTVGTGSMMSVTSIYEEIEKELKKLLITRFLLSYRGPIPIVLHVIFYFFYLLYHVDR